VPFLVSIVGKFYFLLENSLFIKIYFLHYIITNKKISPLDTNMATKIEFPNAISVKAAKGQLLKHLITKHASNLLANLLLIVEAGSGISPSPKSDYPTRGHKS
jgi:hypothetical protein